jgi:hypothetical protein
MFNQEEPTFKVSPKLADCHRGNKLTEVAPDKNCLSSVFVWGFILKVE